LDTVIALLAADLHREYKLATADAITCDAHFETLPDVSLFSRNGGKD
jgi:hypothetical protein